MGLKLRTFYTSRLLAGVLSLTVLAQCGGKGPAADVEIKVLPDSPTVINADLTLNPNTDFEVNIAKPWFAIQYRINNQSDRDIVLVTFTAKITAFVNGRLKEATAEWDPGALSPPRTALAEIDAGEEYFDGVVLYADDLIKEVDGFRYSVVLSAEGWFVNPDDGTPENRFNKDVRFFTQ